MSHFCRVCGTADPDLKHVRAFINWFPDDTETPRIELIDPEMQQDHGIVLCTGCICGITSKAIDQGLILGAKE